MKKLILSIAVLLAASQGFAHGWTVSRRTCLGGDRYQAWASLSEAKAIPTSDGGFMVWMIVGYSGTQPVYGWVYHSGPVTDRVEIAKTRNVGCSRPKSTWCNHPKGISYGYSETTLDVGGREIKSSKTTYSALKAGTFDNIVIDTAKFGLLDKDGYSETYISSKIDIDGNGNNLLIDSLNGALKIASNSNYYSTYRIIVVKESSAVSQEAIDQRELDYSNMIYNNIVAEGSVTLTKTGIQTSGFLNGLFTGQPNTSNGDYIYLLSNISTSIPLDRNILDSNEDFTVIALVDGGFDFDLCKPTNLAKKTKEIGLESEIALLSVHPNPANATISIDMPSNLIGKKVEIEIFDAFGKSVNLLFAGNLTLQSSFKNITVNDLPAGVYTVCVRSEFKKYFQKLVIK